MPAIHGATTVIAAGDLLNAKGCDIISISEEASVLDALRVLAERNIGALLVFKGESLAGIFSERDYARKLVLKGKFSRETRVSEVMTEEVVTADVGDSVERCMETMTNRRVRHLPVVRDGKVVGVISIGDIVKAIISAQRTTIDTLEDYITGGR